MPFCSTCGADITNKGFCVQCGTPARVAQPGAQQVQPGVPVTSRKTSPIVWILVGILGFIVLIGILISLGGAFLVHKIRQNPAMAAAKVLTAANPDVEVLSADQGNNTVTFKNKKTGETVTMNFDDLKKGKVVFKSDGKEAVLQAHGDGQNGTVEITSQDGTVKFGAGSAAKIPKWVPVFPGVQPQVTFSMQGDDSDGGTFQFKTQDSAKTVLEFYEKSLKDAGFKITANISGNIASSSGAMLAAENSANHTVVVTAGTEGSGANVNVVFGTKK